MISTFPDEALLAIFKHLRRQDVGACARVDKNWKRMSEDNEVWRSVAQKEFLHTTPLSLDLNIKELIYRFHLSNARTNDEIIDKFQRFLDRYSLDQNCRFRCILGAGRGAKHITVTIKCLKSLTKQIDHKEDCRCTHGIGDGSLVKYNPYPDLFKYYGFSHSIYDRIEPDYSLPEQNSNFKYSVSKGQSSTHQFTIQFPSSVPQESDLEQQIFQMTGDKCTEVQNDKEQKFWLPIFIVFLTTAYFFLETKKRISP